MAESKESVGHSHWWQILGLFIAFLALVPLYINLYNQATSEGKPEIVVTERLFRTYPVGSKAGWNKAEIVVELRNVGNDTARKVKSRFQILYKGSPLEDSRLAEARIGWPSSVATIPSGGRRFWRWTPDTVADPQRYFCEAPTTEAPPIRLLVEVNWENDRGRLFKTDANFEIRCVLQERKTPIYLWYQE